MKMSKDSSTKYKKKQRKKKLCERYQDYSEEEENKKWEYGCDQYKNFPENEKQRLVSWVQKQYKLWENKTASQIKNGWCFLANKGM